MALLFQILLNIVLFYLAALNVAAITLLDRCLLFYGEFTIMLLNERKTNMTRYLIKIGRKNLFVSSFQIAIIIVSFTIRL